MCRMPKNNLTQQADLLGDHILDRLKDTSEGRNFNIEWLKWISKKKIPLKVKSIQNYFLNFVDSEYNSQFKEVLGLCSEGDGKYSIRTLISLMSSSLAEAVNKKFGLEFNLENMIEDVSIKQGLGSNLAKRLLERYNFDISNLDRESIDFADLIHAAYFSEFPKAVDAHQIRNILSSYLSSTRSGGNRNPVHNPEIPPLDSIIAFFNSYDDSKAIENVLFDIEKRKITRELSNSMKPLQKDLKKYSEVLGKKLEEIILNIQEELHRSKTEGSKRILNRLKEKYTLLRNFKLKGIINELHGQAFPRFYQIEAIQDIYNQKRLLIADEMGTGKTAMAVLAAEYIVQQTNNPDLKTLVVTTSSNKLSFKKKIDDYLSLSKKESDKLVSIINGWDRKKKYSELGNKKYLIVNYELLRAKDWRLSDYKNWEVDEDNVIEIKYEFEESFDKSRAKGDSRSKKQYLKDIIRKNINKKNLEKIGDNLDDLLKAYIKIEDLNRAKSVVKNIKKHFDYNYVIFDEIQNAKNPSSMNSKSVLEIANHAEYVTALTGTPFVNGLSDMGALFKILGVYDNILKSKRDELEKTEHNLGIKRESDIKKLSKKDQQTLFKLRKDMSNLEYSIKRGDIKSILLDNPRMVRDYLKPIMVHRRSEEVLNMQPLNFIPDLESKTCYDNMISLNMYQRMIYQILSSHNFKNSSDQLRALQMFLLSGGLYKEKFRLTKSSENRVIPNLPELFDPYMTDGASMKYKALEDLVRKITKSKGNKKKNVVIFSSLYRQNVTKYLQDRLSNICKCLRIDGEVRNQSGKLERDMIISEFNDSDEPTALIATLPTMKEAIELQKNCSNVINLDLPFTWAAYAQAYSRVRRADQDQPVNVYNLLVSNSLDVGKLELILEKKRVGELFLAGSPLLKQELELLEFNENNASSRGFLDKYLERNIDSAMKIMRDLTGKGADLASKVFGTKNRQSEIYADAYMLNIMSAVNTLNICHTLKDLGILKETNKHSLDNKVLDLAAGYGNLAHATGIRTENLELNPFMIERAKEYASSANYTYGLMQDVNKIYGDNRFEVIVNALAFHYASDEEKSKLLYNIHKTLRNKGYLLLTESYKGSNKGNGSIDDNGINNLEKAMEYTGFNIIKSEVIESAGKRFYSLVAQKARKPREFKGDIVLRMYIDDEINPDDLSSEDLKDMYGPGKDMKKVKGLMSYLQSEFGNNLINKI